MSSSINEDMIQHVMNDRFETIDNLSPIWGITLTLQENLNLRIGTQSWKKYINAAFWNYISTPINFTITLFTAISAGQTGTKSDYLSQDQLFYILFVSFILSIINTFFKLKDKAVMNYDALKKYEDFGAEYETIYYTCIRNEPGLLKKYYAYLELQTKINEYSSNGSIEQVNYITELIYLCFKCCFAGRMKRINYRDRYWVLDGRPNDTYKNNFPIDMKRLFREDFEKDKNTRLIADENGVAMIEKNVENIDREDVDSRGHRLPISPSYDSPPRPPLEPDESLRPYFTEEELAERRNKITKEGIALYLNNGHGVSAATDLFVAELVNTGVELNKTHVMIDLMKEGKLNHRRAQQWYGLIEHSYLEKTNKKIVYPSRSNSPEPNMV